MPIPDRPLYKFLGIENNLTPSWQDRLAALLDGKCYLSSAADFNDPFDCFPYLAAPSTKEERIEWEHSMVPIVADAIRREVPAEFSYSWVREVVGGLTNEELLVGLRSASVEMAEAMGVSCFAETLESVLMWSHYASNHQGIALRFEFDPDPATVPLFWKVEYEDVRPTLKHTDFNTKSRIIAKALATKATFWEYEQEWRLMQSDSARTIFEFDRQAITGIVLGAKCSDDVADHVRNIAVVNQLQLIQMTPDDRTFELHARAQ